jgi:hypothetical protein
MTQPKKDSSGPDPQVGYRKPPKANRFPKGRTGNPRGRPPGRENILAVFKRLGMQKMAVRERGKVRHMTRLEAIVFANMVAALKDDSTAMSNIMRLAELQGEFTDHTDAKVVGMPILLPIRAKTTEEWCNSTPTRNPAAKPTSECQNDSPAAH